MLRYLIDIFKISCSTWGRGRRGGVDGGVDVEVSGDSERALRGRGRSGGRGLILNDVVVVLNRVAVPNQPIRPNALAIRTGNRIYLHC